MNLKTFSDLLNKADPIIWKNKTSELKVVSFQGLFTDYDAEIEAILYNHSCNIKQTILDSIEAVEWLKKEPNVVTVSLNINAELSKIGMAKHCEWYKLNPTITFQILEK